MKPIEPRRKGAKGSREFSGRVKVCVQGYDQYSRALSGKNGTPAKGFSLEDTTVDEVYLVLTKAVKELGK